MFDFTTWLKMREATNTFDFCRNGDKNLLLATTMMYLSRVQNDRHT